MQHFESVHQSDNSVTARSGIWSEPFAVHLGNARFVLTPGELCVKDIRIGGELLIEAIYVAVRDQKWNTATIVLRQMSIQARAYREVIARWNAHVLLPNSNITQAVYEWNIELRLGENGLHFEAKGVALQSFWRNRIGVCVLLPDSLAGCRCKSWTHPSPEKNEESIVLPVDISPHQPLKDISSLLVETPNTELTLQFAGEVFEMEDQRNWTDASFKIYGTPLDLPWPVQVHETDQVNQAVCVSWASRQSQAERSPPSAFLLESSSAFRVVWQEVTYPLVSIGIRLACDGVPSELLDLQPCFVQVELSASQWRNERQSAIDGLKSSLDAANHAWGGGLGIVVAVRQALQMDGGDWLSLKAYIDQMAPSSTLIRVVALIDDIPNDCLAELRREWISNTRQALDNCALCVATTRYFAEVNRAQDHLEKLQLPAVGYGINPQVHVFGDSELFSTLNVQSHTAVQAKRLGREVHWWSVTLNPLGNVNEDPRLYTRLGAAWWLGSYIAALRAEVSSATWFSIGGNWGIQPNSPLHRIMAEVSRMASRQTQPAKVAIYAGPGVFGLRMDKAEWLVNCTEKSRFGWIHTDKTNNPRQVWLEPWQILSF